MVFTARRYAGTCYGFVSVGASVSLSVTSQSLPKQMNFQQIIRYISETAQDNTATSSSATAEGPRDALSQLKSCQLLHTKNHIWLEGLPFHVV